MEQQLEEAIKIVCQYDKIGTSLLQRKLSIGYAKAEKLMNELAELGIITKVEGAKIVDVLIKDPKEALMRLKKEPSVDDSDILIKRHAMAIEKILESFKITARVAELQKEPYYIEYRLEVALGTKLDDIIKREKDIALATASPSGHVKIKAPIPGRSLVGISVPIFPKDLEKVDKWRLFLFVLLTKISDWTKDLAYKILAFR